MIIDEIKKANMQALKDKDTIKRDVLSIAINKYMLANIEKKAEGKTFEDADMISILQKTIKELTETAENYQKVNNTKMAEEQRAQAEVLANFLPKMMSKEEIAQIIKTLPDTQVPTVMKHFKQNYAGKVDMRDVQEVLKSL